MKNLSIYFCNQFQCILQKLLQAEISETNIIDPEIRSPNIRNPEISIRNQHSAPKGKNPETPTYFGSGTKTRIRAHLRVHEIDLEQHKWFNVNPMPSWSASARPHRPGEAHLRTRPIFSTATILRAETFGNSRAPQLIKRFYGGAQLTSCCIGEGCKYRSCFDISANSALNRSGSKDRKSRCVTVPRRGFSEDRKGWRIGGSRPSRSINWCASTKD